MTDRNDDMTRTKYLNEIESIAEQVREAVAEDDMDESDAVFEWVDSHQWIIYYAHNLDVLRHSREDPQEWRHLAEDGAGWRDVIQAMAFDAMRGDVRAELNRRRED